jgi:hypothetical protein
VGKLPGPDVAIHPIHQPNVHVKTWTTNKFSIKPTKKNSKNIEFRKQEAVAWVGFYSTFNTFSYLDFF